MDTDPLLGLGLTPIRPGDREVFNSFLSCVEKPLSDYTLANTLIWANAYRSYWAILNGCLCQFGHGQGVLVMIRPPLGDGDIPAALADALDICRSHNASTGQPRATLIECASDTWLQRHTLPGWQVRPCSGDYVYSTRRMIDLDGGDLASKRQMRNRFARRYPARTEAFGLQHVAPCLDLLETWNVQVAEQAQPGPDYAFKRCDEMQACRKAIRWHDQLGLRGMVLYAADRLVGFTFGEPLGADSFSVVIEKTDRDFTGSANYIYSEFCRQHWADRPWTNAGDDWEIENLARVKESYRPAYRLAKFNLIPPVPVVVAVPEIPAAAVAASVGRPARMFAAGRREPAHPRPAYLRLHNPAAGVPAGPPAAPGTCPRAGREDLDVLWMLERQNFQSKEAFSRRQLRYLLSCPRASTHLVRLDGQIVGSAILLRRRTPAGLVGRLYSLAVKSTHRGQGLGRLLLEEIIVICRREGMAKLRLEVRADNTPAVGLYGKSGFVVEDRLPDYYGPGRDGLKMRLDLKAPHQAQLFEEARPAAAAQMVS